MKRVFLTSLIIGLLAGSVFAQGPGMRGGPRADFGGMDGCYMGERYGDQPGGMHGALMGIDLSEKQEKSIAKLKRDHRVKMTELKSDMAGVHAKGKLLIVNDKVKDSEIKAFADKISTYSRNIAIEKMSHARNVRGLLNEDQQLSFDNNVLKGGPSKNHGAKKMHKRMRKMHGSPPFGD